MSIPDLINGSFEMLGGAFILLSIRKLLRDKIVRGVSWIHVFYFAVWGIWNLYYYPSLGQTFSFIGGISVAVTNTIYTALLIWYTVKGGGE